MASQAVSQRPLSAIEKAMLEELGSHRLDDLPMDDGTFSHRADVPLGLPVPRAGPINNKWRTAIANGAFDDDDATQVAGMENIADGQLARIHRASRLAGLMVTASYDDQRLRRGQCGQIDPRAQFPRGQRGPSVAGRAHHGDGPVKILDKLSNNHHAPVASGTGRRPSTTSASPGSHEVRRGTAPPGLGRRPGKADIPSAAYGTHPPHLPGSMQPNQSRVVSEPTAVRVQNSDPRHQQQQPPCEDISLVLPDGAHIVFQVRAELASPAFVDKSAKFPGIVYLIAGRDLSDDQIMFRVDNERIEDVKHSPKEYGHLLTQSQEVILQFRTAAGRTTWYVVKFRQRDDMAAFVNALRNFVDNPDKILRTSSNASQMNQGHTGAGDSVINAALQATVPDSKVISSSAVSVSDSGEAISTSSVSTPFTMHPPPTTHSTEPPTSVQPLAAQTAIASSPQQDAATTVPANLVEDIVTWVIDIVTAIRDVGPVEMAKFDMLPGVIRGTAAAVLLNKHPGFGKLTHQQRAAYIDKHCTPRVFEMFKRRLREQAAQNQPDQTVQTTKPQDQTSWQSWAPVPFESRRIVYTAEQMMRLRSAAKSPPHWLLELGFLKEARSSRKQTRTSSVQRNEAHDVAMPDHKSQIQQVAEDTEWLHNGRASECSASASSSPKKGGLIGLFVTNTATDAEALELIADEDQYKIVKVIQWGPMNRVLKFRTTKDRDGALQRIPSEFRTRSQHRSKPFVDIFETREARDTGSTIRSASGTGSRRGSYRSPSPMRGRSASSLTPGSPAITVTAPVEQDNAECVSLSSQTSMQWGTEPQGSSNIEEIEAEEPSSDALDEHSGLNASRYNTDNVDLLGETSGSWTGVLAKNMSYMRDLMSLL
ncbi:hypothetical protein VMCG_06543 [Cytospora schulzeri]|uniref:RNA-binding domain-containing protein n=1 Tax=Cytospora schulzeri TaxID=448051 RepID=A0A423WBI4_9PEZI|nr:hypothetical protein VMCG_06543 [Valsa malicola]